MRGVAQKMYYYARNCCRGTKKSRSFASAQDDNLGSAENFFGCHSERSVAKRKPALSEAKGICFWLRLQGRDDKNGLAHTFPPRRVRF